MLMGAGAVCGGEGTEIWFPISEVGPWNGFPMDMERGVACVSF